MLTAKKYYKKEIFRHLPFYLLGIIAMLITSASEVMVPKFIQWTIDFIIKHSKSLGSEAIFSGLNQLVLGLIGVYLLAVLGRIGWRQAFARRTHMAGFKMKNKIWKTLRHQPLNTFHHFSLGDLMNRSTTDWNKSRFILGFTIVLTLDVLFFTVLALVSMFSIDVELTLAALIVIPFLPKLVIKVSKMEYKLHTIAQKKLSDLSDLISQVTSTVRLQRATGSEENWQKKLIDEADQYANKRYQFIKTSWKIFPIGALPTVFAYGILLTWGVYKVRDGQLTVGEFIALQSYVLMLQIPLFELGDVISEWQTGFASLNRLMDLFNLKKNKFKPDFVPLDVPIMDSNKFSIVFENLSYSYPSASKKTLNDISLNIKKGQKIGLCGEIGAGKSTLLQCVAGVLEYYEGGLEIFQLPVSSFKRQQLAKIVTMVPQNTFLFAGTIRYNLSLDLDISDRKILEILQAVEFTEDLKGFSKGLDTTIGEWGITLSGGQKQRLALARAFLRPSPILLLDDCLSAIDADTEHKILENLKFTFKDKTIIWVAHRASTLKLCDVCYELKNGVLSPYKNLPK